MAGFGERIKELRKQRELTQRQMADVFGITERNYQRYEVTDSPSNDTLLKFAEFFGVSTDYLLGRTDYNYKFNDAGNIVVNIPGDFQSILGLDTDKLRQQLDDSWEDRSRHRLQILFDEPLQSYAVWLRNVGIPISGGGISGRVVVEIETDDCFDITDNLDAILKMSKEHFKLLARQFGKAWPQCDNDS